MMYLVEYINEYYLVEEVFFDGRFDAGTFEIDCFFHAWRKHLESKIPQDIEEEVLSLTPDGASGYLVYEGIKEGDIFFPQKIILFSAPENPFNDWEIDPQGEPGDYRPGEKQESHFAAVRQIVDNNKLILEHKGKYVIK